MYLFLFFCFHSFTYVAMVFLLLLSLCSSTPPPSFELNNGLDFDFFSLLYVQKFCCFFFFFNLRNLQRNQNVFVVIISKNYFFVVFLFLRRILSRNFIDLFLINLMELILYDVIFYFTLCKRRNYLLRK